MAIRSTSSSTSEPPRAPPPPLVEVAPSVYEIPTSYRSDMRVPARIFASPETLPSLLSDHSVEQLVNVTTLPGIVGAACGMPDMHEGYGFPVGGVAATALPDGVISPGGIGFDINCGVRLLVSNLERKAIADRVESLVHELSRSVPSGAGRGGRWSFSGKQLDRILEGGAGALVRDHEVGTASDLEAIESGGALEGADASAVSERARQRGADQLGTLGSGNHFLEVQVVDEVFDEGIAGRLGLAVGRVTVLVHSGSRGLGHQVCTDHVRLMDSVMQRYGIHVPDRQLACAPLSSPEGQQYFAAMCAAANFGFANRHLIAHLVRDVFRRMFGDRDGFLRLIYDVGHNTAKIEKYEGKKVCVHRKGATRAFGPGSRDVPAAYRDIGQPVFIPGSMGTSSFVCVGTEHGSEASFGSTCHGAGRQMSRTAAKKKVTGQALRKELEGRGIVIRCASNAELAEEAPVAYKDVDRVVDVVAAAGIARKVARLRPIGVVKG
ncbi:RtcB family protein [Polyangium sp. 6x1]|uniref:RtcB family protein n=1 Tax=Polyangium sp. 6x1 TaxID=3042689 RepID=UPI0024831B7D|nr:RtcB family protein [Polyangium sp. 6x1]MDI1450561.1 RtcB family protein [Polyangium sp. 6x1]